MKYTYTNLIHTPAAKIFSFFILTIASGLAIIPSSGLAATPYKLSAVAPDSREDEKFDRTFREGRELIDKEEWAKAAAKFNEIACDCPGTKNADAALYWLAFCYKKLNKRTEAYATIDRLSKSFPTSSWVEDARVMMFEISAASGGSSGFGPARASGPRNANRDANSLFGDALATASSTSSGTPIDREDEIRLAAFQSLYSADPKRGLEVMSNMLKADSKASETLRIEVVRSLRRSGNPFFATYDSLTTTRTHTLSNADRTALNPAIREALVHSFANEPSLKVRTEILSAIAGMPDDDSQKYLVQLYNSAPDKETKKMIINSLGGSSYAYFGSTSGLSGAFNDQTAVNLNAYSPSSQKNGHFDKLIEIVRTEKDSELKRLAYGSLQRFSGWSTRDGVLELATQLYDSETDEDFKLSIIRSMAGSNQNRAINKLLSIAKTDKSDKLRLAAIRSLSTSTSPEVIKFLEDLTR